MTLTLSSPFVRRLTAVTLLGSLAVGLSSCRVQKPAWEPLLTPGSLEGWHAASGGEWEWRGIYLVGKSDATEERHGLLVSDRLFDDFEVHFDFRTLEGCSGFYFRVEETDDGAGVHGFQAEVDPSLETGGLYETGGRGWVVKPDERKMKRIYKPGDWAKMRITAKGGDIVVHVNGHVTARLRNDTGRSEGRFALQLHGNQDLHVEFKNVVVRDYGAWRRARAEEG